MSVIVEVTKMIIDELRATTALTSQLYNYAGTSGVFAHVPQDFDEYPYVVLYDTELNNDDNDANLAFDGVLNLHTWSDSRDMATVGNIQNAIYNALHHAELTMTGYDLVELHQEFTTIMRDPDGITLHGVQRFRVILETTTI